MSGTNQTGLAEITHGVVGALLWLYYGDITEAVVGEGRWECGGALETRLGLLPERGPHSVRPSRPFTAAVIFANSGRAHARRAWMFFVPRRRKTLVFSVWHEHGATQHRQLLIPCSWVESWRRSCHEKNSQEEKIKIWGMKQVPLQVFVLKCVASEAYKPSQRVGHNSVVSP